MISRFDAFTYIPQSYELHPTGFPIELERSLERNGVITSGDASGDERRLPETLLSDISLSPGLEMRFRQLLTCSQNMHNIPLPTRSPRIGRTHRSQSRNQLKKKR